MRVKHDGTASSGNVGIGTDSPGTINSVAFSGVGLHVKSGTLGRTITEGSNEASYLLNNSGASANQRIKYIQSTAGNLAIGSFDDNGLARPQITVLNSGNVGINTTNPQSKLQIDNTGLGEFAGADSSQAGGSHLMLKDEGSTSRTLMSGPSIVFLTPANTDGTNIWATSRLLGSPAAAGSARGTMGYFKIIGFARSRWKRKRNF